MPIFESQPELTEGSRSLDLFTDRVPFLRVFCERLHTQPLPETILFFHGVGGIGKSLLLRYLRQNACKLLAVEDWGHVRTITDEDSFHRNIVEAVTFTPVPSTWLDFGAQPVGEDRPRESFSALLMIRRQLGRHGIQTPLYDFAALWYLYKTQGQIPPNQLRQLFPEQAMNLAEGVVDLISQGIPGVSLGKALLDLGGKTLGERFTLYRHRRRLTEEEVARIQSLELQPDLMDELPVLLARDLNAAMRVPDAPARLVLFFDTHEALFTTSENQLASRENLGDATVFARDEWLRCLLGHLDLTAGIVPVLAGRDVPRWPEAARLRIPSRFIDIHLVGNLSHDDALRYLTQAGVTDPVLQETLVAFSEGHPYFLGLCAEIVLAAEAGGFPLAPADFVPALDRQRKNQLLVERFLKYVDDDMQYAIEALCAARSFDWPLYRHLGQELGFHPTQAAFKRLIGFSFVTADESQRYRMHNLLRRQLAERANAYTTDNILESYYRAQIPEETAHAEAIYHAARQDAERGINEWRETFDAALHWSRWRLCDALEDVAHDIEVSKPEWLGAIQASVGDYFRVLSRYREATNTYLLALTAYDQALHLASEDVNAHNSRGNTLTNLGEVQASLSQHQAAIQSYEQALAAFDEALRLTPEDVYAHNSRGIALMRLGELQASLAQHQAAVQSYEQSVAALNEALRLAPEDVNAHLNLGNTLMRLGELQASLSQHQAAIQSYEQAVAAFDEALRLAPEYVYAHNSRGNTLTNLGELQASLSQHQAAIQSYEQALAAFDEALRLAPEDVYAHNSRGIALKSLGELQASLFQHQAAIQSYEQALAAFDEALRLAPEYVNAHLNLGNTLMRLGELQASLSQHQAAIQSYEQAVAAFDEALRLAPEDVKAHNNRGIALKSLGELQASLSQHQAAIQSYEQAVAAFDEALRLAPEYVYAHNSRGIALKSLGELQASLSQHQAAIQSYEQALAAFDEALRLAPEDVYAHNNRGLTLKSLGQLQASLFQHQAAIQSYEQAVAAFDEALRLAPESVKAHLNLGNTLMRLGELQASLSQHQAAIQSYEQAVAAFDEALRLAPEYVYAHNSRGVALTHLGDLQASLSQHQAAIQSYEQALAAFDEALRLIPENKLVQKIREQVLILLAEAQHSLQG